MLKGAIQYERLCNVNKKEITSNKQYYSTPGVEERRKKELCKHNLPTAQDTAFRSDKSIFYGLE